MRTILSFLLLSALALALGCGANSNTPSGVAKAYLTHMGKGEYAKAKTYCTEEAARLVDFAIGMGTLSGGITSAEQNKPHPFSIEGETIEGDVAEVNFKDLETGQVTTLPMLKVDGKWKVNQTSLK